MLVTGNKTANYVLLTMVLVGLYFGFVFIPLYIDNYVLKNAARQYISASREEKYEPAARKNFFREAHYMNIKLPEEAVVFERLPGGQTARVSAEYVRDAEYMFTDKKKRLRFKWSITSKFSI
jgi:hypothetical protein